jgi:hypothetical protein
MAKVEKAWMHGVPRSLREAHDRIIRSLFRVERVWECALSRKAARFASDIVYLKKHLDAATAAMGLVEDEFAAVATEVPEWNGIYGSSWHGLVLEHSLKTGWLMHRVAQDSFPGAQIKKRVRFLRSMTADDVRAWAEKTAFRLVSKYVGEPLSSRIHYCLKQELCRAVDRRMLTGRSHPVDKKPLSNEEIAKSQQLHDRVKKRFRPTRARNLLWLRWRTEEGLTPAKIRDRWNSMPDAQRRELSPQSPNKIGKGEPGRDLVKKCLRAAEERSD